jgi:hypothetical protein
MIPVNNHFPGAFTVMAYFLSVLGLALVIEGIPYFAFPDKMKSLMERIQTTPSRSLRIFGSIAMGTGLLFISIAQSYLR